jgi:threonine/homoserine/homoserine lactone efflux protein
MIDIPAVLAAARIYRRIRPWIEGGCGLFLVGFGIRQAFARP